MEWIIWKKYYKIIVRKLNIDSDKDKFSGEILNKLLESRVDKKIVENELSNIINGKDIFVYGCGPSLYRIIKGVKNYLKKQVNIAADGAISALIKENIPCQISVTDLDGNIEDLIYANSKGTITIIHAHGDNVDLIKKYVKKFRGKILGSIQTEPFVCLVNYGGFTDGDRSIFLAKNFNCNKIILIGFDFDDVVGEYSKPELGEHKASERKKIKLDFALFLISELIKKYGLKIYTLSEVPKNSGIIKMSIKQLKESID